MQRIIQTLVDDIDGTEATSTVTFSVSGVDYTIDLNDKNAAKFEKALTPFVEHATRIGGTTSGQLQNGAIVVSRKTSVPGVSWFAEQTK